MDPLSGHIGGEFRLAYYYNGEKEIPVTKGSVSLIIEDQSNELSLYDRTLSIYGYEGPAGIAVKLSDKN